MTTVAGLGLPEVEGSGHASLPSYQVVGLCDRKAGNARAWLSGLVSKSDAYSFSKGEQVDFITGCQALG